MAELPNIEVKVTLDDVLKRFLDARFIERPHRIQSRFCIISNGQPNGTALYDRLTGQEVDGVKSIEWNIGANGKALAEAKIVLCAVSIVAVVDKPKDGA